MARELTRRQIRDLIKRQSRKKIREAESKPARLVFEDVEVLSDRLSRRQIRRLIKKQIYENKVNYTHVIVRDELKNFLHEFDLSALATKAVAAKAMEKVLDYGSEMISGDEEQETPASTTALASTATDTLVADLSDARKAYDAMDGLGTDDDDIEEIFQKRSSTIPALYDEFTKVLSIENDTDSGDLVDWLRDDGLDDEAETVAARLKASGKPRVGGLN